MKPFFCRQGSKRKYSEALESLFPKHHTYVEPFLGGGAVFWEKQPSAVEIINDLDDGLITDYELILSAPTDPNAYPVLRTEREQDEFLSHKHTRVADKIVESLIRRCNGFSGRYVINTVSKPTSHQYKITEIANYKKRLQHATLTSGDYRGIVKKYDATDTFFFLDPPYEKSIGLNYAKGSEAFDYEELARCFKHIKGKFLMTINDSSFIQSVFDDFNIFKYIVKGNNNTKETVGSKDRHELLITNYKLPNTWKETLIGGTEFAIPSTYLKDIQKKAIAIGIDPKDVSLAEDGIHKIEVIKPDGKVVRLGRKGYGDLLLWSDLEEKGDVAQGYAEQKQKVFRTSHLAMKGDWKTKKYSPNNLALALLW